MTGITNNIVVRAPVASPDRVEAIIEQAFERQAEVDARHIRVQVSDHTVGLHGHVHSLRLSWWAGGCRWHPRWSSRGSTRG